MPRESADVDVHLFPIGRHIPETETHEVAPLRAIVGTNSHLAEFEVQEVATFGGVVPGAELQAGGVATPKVDGRTQQVGNGRIDRLSFEVGGPAVGTAMGCDSVSVGRCAKLPRGIEQALSGFVVEGRVVESGPSRPPLLQGVLPRGIQRSQGAQAERAPR